LALKADGKVAISSGGWMRWEKVVVFETTLSKSGVVLNWPGENPDIISIAKCLACIQGNTTTLHQMLETA